MLINRTRHGNMILPGQSLFTLEVAPAAYAAFAANEAEKSADINILEIRAFGSFGRIYLGGELHLTVETVAEIYLVDVAWLREVVASGLLDDEPQLADSIAAVHLDHVATIVRLHRVLGLDVEAIRLALEGADRAR